MPVRAAVWRALIVTLLLCPGAACTVLNPICGDVRFGAFGMEACDQAEQSLQRELQGRTWRSAEEALELVQLRCPPHRVDAARKSYGEARAACARAFASVRENVLAARFDAAQAAMASVETACPELDAAAAHRLLDQHIVTAPAAVK